MKTMTQPASQCPSPMSSREVVRRTISFQRADRLPYCLLPEYGTDFYDIAMHNSPDWRPRSGVDGWGCVWENIGVSKLGEVKTPVLPDWSGWDKLKIPDVSAPQNWEHLHDAREKAGDKFLLAWGISLYERIHFIRGLENTWADIYTNPQELKRLIDLLVEMNIYAIKRFADLGADGYIWCDDWGLQNCLMISPSSWCEIWRPAYERVYRAAHDVGLQTFLHSCGDITAILDDLIDIGLDVIQMDQQENMGLEQLGTRFSGRITFWNPVDIQATMAHGSLDDIRKYCRTMVRALGKPEGGFIAKWYTDPVGAGHRREAIDAMAQEFVKISQEHAGGSPYRE